MSEELTQKELKERFKYDPKTGVFTRLISVSSNTKAGDIAGYKNGQGYITVTVKDRKYRMHRLAFLYMNGKFPKHHVDHINGVRDDNRWENLREATNAENLSNRGKNKNNKSGYKGVNWHNQRNKWVAYIMIDGDHMYLGLFEDIEDAHKAYCEAANKHHREFANHG